MKWFDTHSHLQATDFDQDRAEVMARAEEAGVSMILLPGSDLADSRKACDLALEDRRLVVAVGVHPHEAKHYTSAMHEDLRQLVMSTNLRAAELGRPPIVVAIGEIGLDYHYEHSPREIQKDVYYRQLALAHELGLPVIIHERESALDNYTMLSQAQQEGLLAQNPPGVLHCYSGSLESSRLLLKLGFYLGFDGPITYKNAKRSHEVIRACPHDRLVIETDAPYLTPEPFRGKRNEPAYLPHIGAKIAELWDLPLAETAQILTENSRRLFRIEK
ncbi:MAG: TatD family hydrolase [Clostridiaceae bacterium]|jgi:TatD DNase family protein|nr:TatD family hydrolase [Clostridiaceae bacterium]